MKNFRISSCGPSIDHLHRLPHKICSKSNTMPVITTSKSLHYNSIRSTAQAVFRLIQSTDVSKTGYSGLFFQICSCVLCVQNNSTITNCPAMGKISKLKCKHPYSWSWFSTFQGNPLLVVLTRIPSSPSKPNTLFYINCHSP